MPVVSIETYLLPVPEYSGNGLDPDIPDLIHAVHEYYCFFF